MTELAHGMLAGLDEVAGIGADGTRGGYSRHLWDDADLELREWFVARASAQGLTVERDRNANIWAWWGEPGDGAVVTGSHLDSVPGGGAYDGPLGVVSALDAVGRLQRSGFRPSRPVAVVVFAEEEGSRFGVACLGSGLMTGALDPARVRGLRDRDGISFGEAAERIGFSVDGLGRDPEALRRIGVFVELHVEQGRGLVDLGGTSGAATGLAGSILAHGRWTLTFRGQGNHAGATAMADRDDPMIAAARGVLAIRETALEFPGSRATVGRIAAHPGGTNVIASSVTVSLDARAPSDRVTRALVEAIAQRVEATAFVEESWTPSVSFDRALIARIAATEDGLPVLPSGAGHDAGILAAEVPTAMIFVRNPTGISHAPEEFASLDDCVQGIDALERTLRVLLA